MNKLSNTHSNSLNIAFTLEKPTEQGFFDNCENFFPLIEPTFTLEELTKQGFFDNCKGSPKLPLAEWIDDTDDLREKLFLNSPAKNELALKNAMFGRMPFQVRKIILDEYKQRFKEEFRIVNISNILATKRITSWDELETQIIMTCRVLNKVGQSTSLSEEYKDQIIFFDKFRHILKSPIHRNAMFGKETLQAIRIILEEYEQRFKEKFRVFNISRILARKGMPSWYGLETQIIMTCRVLNELSQSTGLSEEYDNQSIFFDNMRSIVKILPKKMKRDYHQTDGEYDVPEEKRNYVTPQDVAGAFEPCFSCWRSVPRFYREKRKARCYEHPKPKKDDNKKDFQRKNNEDRRRKRMKEKMKKFEIELYHTVPKTNWIRENTKFHPRDFYLAHLCHPEGHFPALAEYLYDLNGGSLVGMRSSDVIRLLEGPTLLKRLSNPEALDPLEKTDPNAECMNEMEKKEKIERAAWEFHFEDCGAYFEKNYDRLIRAEAWLRAEATYKQGGRRVAQKNQASDTILLAP